MRLLHRESVRRYLCDGRLLPRETVAEMLARSDALDAEGLGLWIVEEHAVGIAGIAGLEPVSAEASVSRQMQGAIEPIIALAPECTGKGLARDCLEVLIGHARRSLRLERLVAAVDEPNLRSHALMRRTGFTVMGKERGPAHALVLYEKLLTGGAALDGSVGAQPTA